MSRKLRLKCPACGTLIETSVEDELRITLQCAACHHQFSAKVPTRAENSPAATSRPTVAARPVTAKPTSGPVAARPVAARPVAARPAATMPVTSAPIAPTPPASDPLFGGVAEFNFPVAPTAYQPVRKRKPINLRPLLTICGSILGVCLAITLGVYGWHWAANTDWSTFSLTRDTPEQMLAEVYAKSEEHGKDSINMLTDQAIDYEQVKKRFLQTGKWAERFLVRSVRLGKVPEKLKPAFRDKMAALIKSNHEATRAKLDELKASGRQPTGDQTRYTELMLEPNVMAAAAVSIAATVYLEEAFFDLPQPTNDIEKIYYEEADLVHEYLKLLTFVRNKSQSKTNADKIEKLADKMMDLAARRSKMPANRLEQVPREYVSKDRGFSAAQKALIARVRRDADPDEKLKDAVANFNDARDLLIEASTGKSDASLRSRFAEFRKLRSESTERAPGDLFYIDLPGNASPREMVVKPRGENQPDPVREPPRAEPKPQPAADSLASNNSATSANSAPPAFAPKSVESIPVESNSVESKPPAAPSKPSTENSLASTPPAMQSPADASNASNASNDSTPSPLSPGLRDHFFRGMQSAMQEGMRRGAQPAMPPPGFGAPPPGFGAPPPGFGAPPAGPGMGMPPGNNPAQGGYVGGDPPGMPAPLPMLESVKIIITQSKLNGDELVKRLAAKLESGTYQMSYTNGKITMQLKYSGDLDRVVKLIDFGKVTLIDSPERTIHVVGK